MFWLLLIGLALGAVITDTLWRRYHRGYRAEVERFLEEHGLIDKAQAGLLRPGRGKSLPGDALAGHDPPGDTAADDAAPGKAPDTRGPAGRRSNT